MGFVLGYLGVCRVFGWLIWFGLVCFFSDFLGFAVLGDCFVLFCFVFPICNSA